MKNIIFDLIDQEKQRQENTINLIASENYAPPEILAATGSVLTNKYAEGYPAKRYYGGCSVIDLIELKAIELGKKLFNAEHINVQSHSGSNANLSVYFGLLKPGDTILGMSLAAGGHLTHGHKINFSGTFYNVIQYGVSQETELIDYDQVQKLANEHKPKLIVAGASAYARLIDYQKLNTIATSVGAYLLVDMAHIAGLIAANCIPSPIPWSDVVSSTTHKTLRGPRGGLICCKEPLAQIIDKAVMPGTQGGPLMHIIAAKAIAFELALQKSFTTYAQQIITNAQAMAETFKNLGYRLVSNGTDTHLFLIDLRNAPCATTISTGADAEKILEQCNIVVNRNGIPFDPLPPTKTSGLRIGTPAITTRGLGPKECIKIAELIDYTLKNTTNDAKLLSVKKDIDALCKQFPIYQQQTVA